MIISKKPINLDIFEKKLEEGGCYMFVAGPGYELLAFGLQTNLTIKDIYTKERFITAVDNFIGFRTIEDYDSPKKLILLIGCMDDIDIRDNNDNYIFTKEHPLDSIFNNSNEIRFCYDKEGPDDFGPESYDKSININLHEEQVKLKAYLLKTFSEYLMEEEDDLINKDVIYKNIEDSNKLGIKEDKSSERFSIYPIGLNIPIITLEKNRNGKENEYIFLVDIRDNDEFKYKTEIKTKEDLNKAIDFTIEAVGNHPVFNKYVDDIEKLKQ